MKCPDPNFLVIIIKMKFHWNELLKQLKLILLPNLTVMKQGKFSHQIAQKNIDLNKKILKRIFY